MVLALDFFFMGVGAISVAFVTPSDLPVVGALCSWCAGLRPITLSVVLGSTYFFISFFCLSLYFTFSESNTVDGVVGC